MNKPATAFREYVDSLVEVEALQRCIEMHDQAKVRIYAELIVASDRLETARVSLAMEVSTSEQPDDRRDGRPIAPRDRLGSP